MTEPSSGAAKVEEMSKRVRSLNIGRDFLFRFGLIVFWALMIVAFSILAPGRFLTADNLGNIFGSQAVLLILTLGLLFPLAVGDWDLSIGGVLGLSMTLVGVLNGLHKWPILAVIAIALGAGVVVGLINALTIVLFDVPSLIATLGMAALLEGTSYGISNLTISGLSGTFVSFGQHNFLRIPLPFYYGIALAIVVFYIFRWRPFGRYLFFIGASHDVARLSGIRVPRVRTRALVICSAGAALAGVVLAASLGATGPSIGPGFLLPAMAAAFLGTTVITPGRLNVWGTVVAVYFLITGIVGLQMLGAESYIQQIFYGAILLIAVALSRKARR